MMKQVLTSLTHAFTDNPVRQPAADVTLGGKQLKKLNDRLVNLTLDDNRGFEADTLTLVLDDADGALHLPVRGAQISLSLGWQGEPLVHKGLFTVDEMQHEGPPDQLTLTARSADFRAEFNVQREHSWRDLTVGELLSCLAGRYQLIPAVSEPLINIEIDHADQTNESDISFLTRMADELGAVATVKNGALLLIIPNRGVSASGHPLPEITLTRRSGDSHQFSLADRDAYTGVKAFWLDLNHGKQQTTQAKRKSAKAKTPRSSQKEGSLLEGADGNVFVMRQTFKSEQAAKRAAISKWRQLQRGAAHFTLTLAEGHPGLYPEMPVTVQGFKPAIDDERWIIARISHTLDDNGLTSTLELEKRLQPDTQPAVSEVS